MQIEIISTGDEVLAGKIVNSNFSYMSQKLEDFGLSVRWGTIVGDERASLHAAFREAGARADAVVVNGGLGPTIDDLSQEMAARAAGVELALSEEWLARMEEYFRRRSRIMPANNRKQAMLPAGAEILDNPIGTACGFALTIGKARFFFTPGVPRELRRMFEEQVVPRLLKLSGVAAVIRLKRFHSYGLGESHVDALLSGVEALVPEGGVKLGFRAHYPQLETKLTVRGHDEREVERKLAPVVAEVRRRLGNFILAEDDDTLERLVLRALADEGGTLAILESFTGGAIAARLSPLPGAEKLFRRGLAAREGGDIAAALGLEPAPFLRDFTPELAASAARALQRMSGASHALAALVAIDEGEDRIDLGGTISLGLASREETVLRRARIVGGREWVRLGAIELALDFLRRHLLGLPTDERIDFEKV